MRKRISCLIIIYLTILSGLYAQNHSEEVFLTDLINQLEIEHKVKFNYAENLIKNIKVIKPAAETNITLQETLKYLEAQTDFSFTLLSSEIILIQKTNLKTICGCVRDLETGQPIESSTIRGLKGYAISDELGNFKIAVQDGFELLEIRCLGYDTTVKNAEIVNNNQCVDVLLTPRYQRLTEVLVSNYIVAGINKINNNTYEIDFENFDILPGLIETDVLQSVQSFPGVQSVNETVSNISIRGGSHDQNLILWDGIKMYQSGHFFGLISMYNPQITQQVSLVKNGTNASNTDGVSGTIDMQTNQFINKEFKGVASVNLTNINGFADIPLGDKSSVQIAARRSINDIVKTPTYRSFYDRISQNTELNKDNLGSTNSNQEFNFYDTSLRWIYRWSKKDKLRLNFINVYNKLVFDENAIVESVPLSRKSSLSQQSIAGAMYYERSWNPNWQTELELYETDYKLKSINANIEEMQRFLQENTVSETSFKVKSYNRFNSRLLLLNGYHFIEAKVTNLDDVDNPLYRLKIGEVLRTHGVFSQLNYQSLNGKTNLYAGLRFSYLKKFDKGLLEPRFSLSQKLFKNITWELQGEFKHQTTSQIINFQNDFLGIEKRRWQLSNNQDIPVIQSRQISSGAIYSNKGWLLNVEGYYKNIIGITVQSQGFQNQLEFNKSEGEFRAKGIEMLIRKAYKKTNTWFSYTYMNSDYKFSDIYNYYFPSNFDITHAVTFGTSYKIKNLNLSAGFKWHSGKPTTIPAEGNEIQDGLINYNSPNTNNLKDYARLDISGLYKFELFKNTKSTIGFSIWNLFDKKNELYNFYRIEENQIKETIQYSLGITPNAILTLEF